MPAKDTIAWEGEAYIDGFGRVRFLDPKTGELPQGGRLLEEEEVPGEMFYPGLAAGKGSIYGLQGHQVRVVIMEKEAGDGQKQ